MRPKGSTFVRWEDARPGESVSPYRRLWCCPEQKLRILDSVGSASLAWARSGGSSCGSRGSSQRSQGAPRRAK